MVFQIDTQTLNDLAVFGTGRTKTIYEIFNRVKTRGGAKLLEEMFLYPLAEVKTIQKRVNMIRYYGEHKTVFPFRSSIFDVVEFYLDNTDSRSQLMMQDNTLERKVKSFITTDAEYSWIHGGIMGCLELFNTLDDFLKAPEDETYTNIAEIHTTLRQLLQNEKWSWYPDEKGKKKISYEKAVSYDKILRFEEGGRIRKMLYYVYLIDVYTTVAQIAGERKFTYPQVYPSERNILSLRGVFHPFLSHPVGNTLYVDKDSSIIFLTGANMAGKSTFMKSVSIAVYLAHVGFPVPAESMEFSVYDGMFTTINLPDNLNMGYSHFYSEVLRLKKVAQQMEQGARLFIVFDELFRGTNVKDAYDATLAVTEAFAEVSDCTFIISTHIIEVGTTLKERCNNIRFVYLPTSMDGNKPVYTYHLTEGITNDRHGMIIINNEKIIDIINGKEDE